MDEFERHSIRARNIALFTIIAMIAIAGSLIGLAVYAINAFTG